MGAYLAQEKSLSNSTEMSLDSAFDAFNSRVLISSKQLSPAQDTKRRLLSMYYEEHKLELEEMISAIYLDALSFDSSRLVSLCFKSIKLNPRQVKLLSIVLPYCTEIKELDFNNSGLENSSIIHITKTFPEITALMHLDIRNNSITDDGLLYFCKGLKYLNDLIYLNISGNEFNRNSIAKFIKGIEELTCLKELYMKRLAVDNEMLKYLYVILKFINLEKLSLKGNKLTDECLEDIILFKELKLKDLDLRNSELSLSTADMILQEFGIIPIRL